MRAPRCLFLASTLALGGCQLILGFEDHTLGSGGSGAGGDTGTGAGTTTTTSAMGGMGGMGGMTTTTSTGGGGTGGGTGGSGTGGGTPTFGTPAPVASVSGSQLNEVAVDSTGIYVLDRGGGRILRFQDGGSMDIIAEGLVGPRGLALDASGVYTTTGNAAPAQCQVAAFTKVAMGTKTVLFSIANAGTNCFEDVAVGTGQAVASTGSNVRKGVSTGPSAWNTIGLAVTAPITSVARGTAYYWLDPSGALYVSTGSTATGQPPGSQVDTVVAGIANPRQVVERAGTLFVSTTDRIGKVSASAMNGSLTDLTTDVTAPTGLSVDGTHAYYIDTGNRVRAVDVGGGTPTTIWTAPAAPFDTASRGDAVFVTAGDTLERIDKN